MASSMCCNYSAIRLDHQIGKLIIADFSNFGAWIEILDLYMCVVEISGEKLTLNG